MVLEVVEERGVSQDVWSRTALPFILHHANVRSRDVVTASWQRSVAFQV